MSVRKEMTIDATYGVCVLNAENPLTTCPARKGVIEQGGSQSSEMERTSWRGCKA